MKYTLLTVLCAALVAGCGGGGGGGSDDDGGGGGNNVQQLSLNTAPTANIQASQSVANSLATEVQDDVPELVSAAASGGVAPKARVSDLPGGVDVTIQCSTLGGGTGSGTITTTSNIGNNGIVTGSTMTSSYNQCQYTSSGSTITFNGKVITTYTRWVSGSNYAMTMRYENFTYSLVASYGTYNYGPLNSTYSFDNNNGVYTTSWSLSNGGATSVSSANIVRTGNTVTITSATYVYNSSAANGVIKVTFSNWKYDISTGKPISGTMTISGANNSKAVIEATGTTYNVTITSSTGAVTGYTVPY